MQVLADDFCYSQLQIFLQEDMMAYTNLICVGFMVIIAWFTFTKSRRSREANEINKSRIWIVVSILAGALAVLNILSLLV
jgi:hypothetical protein